MFCISCIFVKGKRKTKGLPSVMSNGVDLANSPKEIAEMFARHFSSVFNNSTVPAQQINEALTNVPEGVLEMRNITFTEADVRSAMIKLKSSWQPGPDGIPPTVFKKCVETLCTPLTAVFNQSLCQSTFPDAWKESILTPIFKKGDRNDVANYRGITSLSAGSKLLEILVSKQLFHEAKQYISCDQHGFYPGRSTITNLAEFTSFCIRNMENGAQIDTVYTDLKAAFDRVDHNLLVAKMERMGAAFSFIDWLKSYLVGRRLSVKISNAISSQFCNQSGVPQGSNLGPLLFSLFFNDVCIMLPRGCRLLYADDLKIFVLIESPEDCRELQKLINIFVDWCRTNKLLTTPPSSYK